MGDVRSERRRERRRGGALPVQHVEDAVDVPHLRVSLQRLDLLLRLLGQLGAVLGEGLDKIDK